MTGPAPTNEEVSCMLNPLSASHREGCRHLSYRDARRSVHSGAILIGSILAFLCALLFSSGSPATAAERPVRIVALGDSLTAGLDCRATNRFRQTLSERSAPKDSMWKSSTPAYRVIRLP